MKQVTFLQEGSNRILSKVQKSFWSCTDVNSYSKLHYVSISILYTDDGIHGMIKNPKIKEIHKVHQKICTQQVSTFEISCCYVILH